MLCEKCQKHEATCHVTTVEDGISISRDLCAECYEAGSPEAKAFATAQREARCEYCGGQPCASGTDIFALLTGEQKKKWKCMPCSVEHNRYLLQLLQRDTSGLSRQEQLALLRTLNEEADRHMKQWVSGRGPQ